MTGIRPSTTTGTPACPFSFATPRRVVLDTNVLVALYVFADSRYAPLRGQVEQGRWHALVNVATLAEFRRVLAYPQFGIAPATQEEAYANYAAVATAIPATCTAAPALPRCKDPDDQKFLELARDGHAAWLITGDKALLKLARRQRLAGMFRIMTPDAALAAVSRQPTDGEPS